MPVDLDKYDLTNEADLIDATAAVIRDGRRVMTQQATVNRRIAKQQQIIAAAQAKKENA